MSNFKVLVTDHNIRPDGLDLLRESGAKIEILQAFSPQKTLVEASRVVDGILARAATITKDVLTSPNLKVVSRHGVGYENVDVEECTRLGIAVTISGDANSQAVSEHAFALLMAAARNLVVANRIVQSNSWDRNGVVAVELHRKTLGIIGLGRIGNRLARQASGFDMKVLVYDPYASDEAIRTAGAIRVELQDLLSRADFISLHVPLTDETRHIIGRAELERMKPSAILANTARGELIDEQALYDALVSGSIAGAGLDVFEEEPPPENHSLLGLDNVVCSPHVAGQTAEALVRTSLASAENVLRVFRGEVPDVLVNPEVLNNRSRISWNPRIIDLQQT